MLLFLIFVSTLCDSSGSYEKTLTIAIAGAVERPGVYQVGFSAKLDDLKRLAGFLEEANTEGLPSSVAAMPEQIFLPRQGQKVVYLRGAVKKEGYLLLEEGARLKDLKQMGVLSEEADLRWSRRKRLLKNHEEVIVPRALPNQLARSETK